MSKPLPLSHRIYFEPVFTEVCRVVGYAGITYRKLAEQIEELAKRFGKEKVQSAVVHLATYEGQFSVNPKPLAHVQLREEARKACWQLLGPPPEHPWFDLWHKPEPLPNHWNRHQLEETAQEQQKRKRSKKKTA